MFVQKETIRNVRNLAFQDLINMTNFLKQKINDWIQSKQNHPFSLQTFLGGENANWEGTPMQILYDRLLPKGKAYAYKQAAKDAGVILKNTIHKLPQKFIGEKKRCRIYKYIP